jgi:hypothetical protein
MRIRQGAWFLTLLATACGGSTLIDTGDGGGGDDGAPMTPCGRYAQAYCDKKQSCSNGSLITRDYGGMGICVTRQVLACNQSLGAPHTGHTLSLVEQCTSQMTSFSCAEFQDNNLPETCNPIGPGKNGASCTFDAQCATGYCANDRYSTCGTCADAPVAGVSCARSNCAHNQACIWNNVVTNVCEPYVRTGSACGAYSNPLCETDLTCAGASSVTGVGGTCEPALQTLGALCGSKDMGLGCDTTRGLWCTAVPDQQASCSGLMYAGDGMPCGYVSSGVVAVCAAGTCYSSGGPYFTYTGTTQTGTCKAFAADGATCDTSAGPGCMSPARCVAARGSTSGVCTVPVASVSASCD